MAHIKAFSVEVKETDFHKVEDIPSFSTTILYLQE